MGNGSQKLDESVQDEQIQCQPLPGPGEAQQTRPILVQSLLNEEEIQQIKSLSADAASSGRIKMSGGKGNWNTRYLHADGLFQDGAPKLLQKLLDAALAADAGPAGWNLLVQAQKHGRLNPRVIEHHVVTSGGTLSDKYHFDEGSLVTIDVMLSKPKEDFQGGSFCTSEGVGEYEVHDFCQGDALLFVSHKFHFVQHVISGQREVLVIELWEGQAPRCNHRCQQNWGRCGLESS
mmetsp:Transcript_36641/g.92198  ORF Transcript_36641/g.92198 Transcript_36641/m.92198 type:complete len:234 (-) Transcript_36641:55-756(-)